MIRNINIKNMLSLNRIPAFIYISVNIYISFYITEYCFEINITDFWLMFILSVLFEICIFTKFKSRYICEVHELSREHFDKVTNAAKNVLLKANKLDKNNGPKQLHMYEYKSDQVNAFQMSLDGSIAISSQAIIELNNRELEALIAHEVGHLANNDIYINSLVSSSNMTIKLTVYFLSFIIAIIGIFASESWKDLFKTGIALSLFYILDNIISIPLLYTMRQDEYKADYYAKSLGYGKELSKILSMDNLGDKGNILFSTHPKSMLRIERLLN